MNIVTSQQEKDYKAKEQRPSPANPFLLIHNKRHLSSFSFCMILVR